MCFFALRKSEAIFFSVDYGGILRDFMSFARKSEANFFSLDYFIPLRNSTEMKIHLNPK